MVIRGMPALAVTFEPLFDSHQKVTSIAVTVRCDAYFVQADKPFLTLRRRAGNFDLPDYHDDTNSIRVSDDRGNLPLQKDRDPDALLQTWRATRASEGQVTWSFIAPPRQITAATRPGARSDLRLDQGGIIGSLNYFFLRPMPMYPEQQWKISVAWKLDKAPAGTRAMWTFGGGSITRSRLATVDDLINTYLAVGQLQGTRPAADNGISNPYGTYWFGELPPALLGLEAASKDYFQKLSELYQDPLSATNPYRIFIRRADPATSFGGEAFLRSYCLEWSTRGIMSETQLSVFMIISHEMIHNWALLKSAADGPSGNDGRGTAWYNEGVGELHGITLPWRFGLISTGDMIKHLNLNLQAYYTSSVINMSNADVVEHEYEDPSVQLLLYNRSTVYSMLIDIKIRQATGRKKSLDDVIIPLSLRRLRRERHDEAEYRKYLMELLGTDSDLDDMLHGDLVKLPSLWPGFPIHLIRKDRYMFTKGYVREGNVISAVVRGSRAEEAGLTAGDHIISERGVEDCILDDSKLLKVVIKRGPLELTIEFLPRSRDLVPCWEWVEESEAA